MSALAYFRIDGKLIIIGSFAGAGVNPAWVHNLRANPFTATAPGFADYQAKTTRVIPVFELQ